MMPSSDASKRAAREREWQSSLQQDDEPLYRSDLTCANMQGHGPGAQAVRPPHLPHPAAQLGVTRGPSQPEFHQAASGTAGFASGVRTAVPHSASSNLAGPAPRPAGPFGAKAGLSGFRPPFGAGARPAGQPVPAPSSVGTRQPPAAVPPVSRATGPPLMPPSSSTSVPQLPAPGLAEGLQQQPPAQRGPAALGPPRFGRPACDGTGPAATPTLPNGGVPPQSLTAAHRFPASTPVGAAVQRQPPPPPFGAALSAGQQHGPAAPTIPPSTGAIYLTPITCYMMCMLAML